MIQLDGISSKVFCFWDLCMTAAITASPVPAVNTNRNMDVSRCTKSTNLLLVSPDKKQLPTNRPVAFLVGSWYLIPFCFVHWCN